MSELTTRFPIPGERKKLTGRILAKVTSYEMTKSKIDGTPQIAFHFTGQRGGQLTLYMTVTSKMLVNKYLEAGIIRPVGLGEFEITPLQLQPEVNIQLKEDRLVAFSPGDPYAQS